MFLMAISSHHENSLSNDTDGLLETSLESFNESLEAKLISSENIELKGVKGKYAVMEIGESKAKVEYRVFINGYFQYQVVSVQLDDDYDQKTADSFFKSFKILK